MPSLLAILGLDRSGFSSGLDQAKGEASRKGGDIGSTLGGKVAAGLTAAGIFLAAKKMFDAVKEVAAEAKEIQIGSARMDIGTSRFQDLQLAAEKGGSSIEALYGAYRKLAVNADEALHGNKELVAHFAMLGVSIDDLQSKSPDQLFAAIAAGMDGASMNGEKLVATIKTMGKSADELLPAMRGGLFSEKNPNALSKEDLQTAREAGAVIAEGGKTMHHWFEKGVVELDGFFKNVATTFSGGLSLDAYGAKGEKMAKPLGLNDAAKAEAAAASEAADVKKELLKEEEHQRERLVHLIERQMSLNKQFVEGGMNDAEKLAALEARRNGLLKETFDLTTAQGQADAQERNNKLAEANIEIQRLLKGEEASLRRTKPDTNALQRAGAYAGPADRNYTLIQAIEKHVASIAGKTHSDKRTTIGGF